MKRAAKLLLIAAFLVLALSGVALAASAQDIYNDYLDNLRLDGTYTEVELRAFFGDASLHQYGDPALVTSLDTVVSSMLTTERDSFPFTGAQLALMALAAIGLIGGGIGLRRLARSHR
ncbi:MAG: hypothetical protein A2133_07140 [Actinobacteria bacterium RBG_16_64_13]|nr:MAG: hypothetical protein A2133_07140 [Actinobacteria bacterium RBG_16_64_13]